MKINDFVRLKGMDSRQVELTRDIDSRILQLCGHLIIRKDDTNYLIKYRYWNDYATEEANKRFICDINFNVISLELLRRSSNKDRNIFPMMCLIDPGDNLIIEI